MSGKTKSRMKAEGFYVYCIGERESLSQISQEALPSAIESDSVLELIAQENLAAVVSPVPLSDYGDDALQERLTDATWTAVRAMRHEKVVEHFARRTSVVPLRFGTIYLERARVEQMLSERESELRAIIEQLRGREEWGLNIYTDRVKLLENIKTISPNLRELSESAETATPGQSYLIRKKIDAMRQREAREETRRVASKVEQELSEISDDVRRLRVIKDEATEHGELAAKFAFLVARKRFDEFRSAAERVAEDYEGAGFRLELTGPWPAYNFANR
ncbi:MAG TPA: GvpL/GvpF family gas vesicle protein [Pyrinomonadaceae bacterium]|nr:GvpL/GvpF family gas vesicle protein [Pyrinomonadaceae bacterium]